MQISKLKNDLVFDASNTMYPSVLRCYENSSTTLNLATSTYYGIVLSGQTVVTKDKHPINLKQGMFFSITGPANVEAKGAVMIIERLGYRGMDTYGGPLEEHGRLCYIDNCRSSVLVSPARLGDPVLNLLTFPPRIQQTMHIHPTIRMGVIISGRGICVQGDGTKTPLEPNVVFNLLGSEAHCFHSLEEPMTIVAYHPDSDVGPTDENHPMLSRTYTKY